MLKQRHPFMGPGGQNPQAPGSQAANYAPPATIQRQFPRQPIRQQHPAAVQANQVSFLHIMLRATCW